MIKPGAIFRTLLYSVFRKPATENYPAVKTKMPVDFRGQIRFLAHNCIGCKICMRDCPSDAIEIRKVGEKRFEAVFDLGRCIYCAQCVESCPKSALEITDRFELAELNSKKLHVVFEAAPAPEAPPSGAQLQSLTQPPPAAQPQPQSPAQPPPAAQPQPQSQAKPQPDPAPDPEKSV